MNPGVIAVEGFDVAINDNVCITKEWAQLRFPKSKRKRIRKKWRKARKNWGWKEKHTAFAVGRRLYISSQMARLLEEAQ